MIWTASQFILFSQTYLTCIVSVVQRTSALDLISADGIQRFRVRIPAEMYLLLISVTKQIAWMECSFSYTYWPTCVVYFKAILS